MKTVKEKAVEQAFLRVMNKLIDGKDAFIPQDIYQDIYTEEEFTIEEFGVRLEESQQKMMSLTKTGFDEKEYATLAGEIDFLRKRMQRLKGQQTERVLMARYVQKLQNYCMGQNTEITKFDDDIFRRLVEKVKVRSMVEVNFVFRSGIEVREILG